MLELMFGISAEAFAVVQSIEHTAAGETIPSQGAEKRQHSPAAMRCKALYSVPFPPQPRSGVILVLIEISSMKSRRQNQDWSAKGPICGSVQRRTRVQMTCCLILIRRRPLHFSQ
ncbi:hypothetical protein XI00_38200 [Bradyrhizobium sp. CCBAU 21359]|nr:hypothetical protein [Bradyrhizobium sp. CCBAU 21359]